MGSTYDDPLQAVRFCLRKIKAQTMKPFLLLCLLVMGPAHGKGIFTEGDELLVQTSLWTKHYHPEPDHNNHQKLLNLEYYFNDEVKFFVIHSRLGGVMIFAGWQVGRHLKTVMTSRRYISMAVGVMILI